MPERVDTVRLSSAFGRCLRVWRVERGLSQSELAQRAGVHYTYLGLIERGSRNPTLSVVYRVISVLGIGLVGCFEHVEREMAS